MPLEAGECLCFLEWCPRGRTVGIAPRPGSAPLPGLPGVPWPWRGQQMPQRCPAPVLACRAPPAGWFLFQFYRLLQYARPPPGSPKPFFWMFVDNLLLTSDDQATATRFLEVPLGEGGASTGGQADTGGGQVSSWPGLSRAVLRVPGGLLTPRASALLAQFPEKPSRVTHLCALRTWPQGHHLLQFIHV